jgi:hypothetical protein
MPILSAPQRKAFTMRGMSTTLTSTGTIAVVQNGTITLDPGTTITSTVELQGSAALSGNDGGYVIGPDGSILVLGDNALYADGAIVNQGAIGVADSLTIIVENGPTAPYNLLIPSFENLGAVAIGTGATLDIAGTELSNQGNIEINDGTLIVTGGGVDGGQISAPPTASSAALTSLALELLGDAIGPLGSINTTPETISGGSIGITGNGLALFGDAVANQAIFFSGDGTVYFGDPGQVSNVTINNFAPGDTIVTNSAAGAQALLNSLTFTSLPAGFSPAIAVARPELLDAPTPCFARGARLLTPLGYVPVETLKPGDPVITATGGTQAVRWVGSCTIDISAHRRPAAVQPIKITAGALAPGVPAQTLRLSPDHGLFLHNVLVPAKLLVNGATIIRETSTTAVTYYHVELDRHNLLLAEGVPVESYLDTGNRAAFSNTTGNPVFGRSKTWDKAACAPLCLSGPTLHNIRQDIRLRTAELGFRRRTLTDVTLLARGQRLTRNGGTAAQPRYNFITPLCGHIVIQSPRFVPAELSLGQQDEDDNRCLGIALNRITLGNRSVTPKQIAVGGFYPRAANDRADWTDGNGIINIQEAVAAITLHIMALPLGWVRT